MWTLLKRTERISMLVGVVILIIGIIFVIVTHFSSKTSLGISLQTIQESNKEKKYQIDAQYPQIKNVGRETQTVNLGLQGIVMTSISHFKDEIESMQNLPIAPSLLNPSTLTVRYQIVQASTKVISVLFTVEDFPRGAAHPVTTVAVYSYSFVAKKEVILTNLFNQKTEYLKKISTLVSEDLGRQYAKMGLTYDEFISQGAGPRADNFQKFVLTDTAIVFYFDQGSVGPESAGVRKVSIPYEVLKDYFAK